MRAGQNCISVGVELDPGSCAVILDASCFYKNSNDRREGRRWFRTKIRCGSSGRLGWEIAPASTGAKGGVKTSMGNWEKGEESGIGESGMRLKRRGGWGKSRTRRFGWSFGEAARLPVFRGQIFAAVPDLLVTEIFVSCLVFAGKMHSKVEAGFPHFLWGQNEQRSGLR